LALNVCHLTTAATTTKPSPPNITLTASPTTLPPSRAQIYYRTLPTTRTDAQLRQDLRLGCSDVAVWRLRVLERWFEDVTEVGRPRGR
ncbi:hypothetical protein EDD17DRAFT_1670790, partial [Pisolithus thermaeus]